MGLAGLHRARDNSGRTISLMGVAYMTCGDNLGAEEETDAAACSAMNMVRLKARVKVDDLTMGTIAIFSAA